MKKTIKAVNSYNTLLKITISKVSSTVDQKEKKSQSFEQILKLKGPHSEELYCFVFNVLKM